MIISLSEHPEYAAALNPNTALKPQKSDKQKLGAKRALKIMESFTFHQVKMKEKYRKGHRKCC